MNIQPTPIIASLAGTAHAQGHASETARASGGGGAATGQELNKTSEIEAGAKTEDRDADGRQLLERRGGERRGDEGRDEQTARGDQANDPLDADPRHSSLAAEGQGSHIDFDA